MKFTNIVITAALAAGILANPTPGHQQARDLRERTALEAIGRTAFNRALLGKRDGNSACCAYEACADNCANGFGDNPAGQGACIESCGNTSGTGGQACACCMDHTQQPGNDPNTVCANNGGIDTNTDDCTCPN